MTKRFDRTNAGLKYHAQSFAAMEHFDFRKAGAYSYEQAFQTIRKLGLSMDDIEEQFRRMAFNIIARNQDDHVKNIAFLMDKAGQGLWTGTHQMSLNGKRDGFDIGDFETCARNASMKRGRAKEILVEVQQAVLRWPEFAANSGVNVGYMNNIRNTHRLSFISTAG